MQNGCHGGHRTTCSRRSRGSGGRGHPHLVGAACSGHHIVDPGLGAARCGTSSRSTRPASSPVTPFGVVGDLRIRIDPDAVRVLGDGLAWAPGSFFHTGRLTPMSRGTLRRVEERLTAAASRRSSATKSSSFSSGPTADDSSELWRVPLAGVLEHEGFVSNVVWRSNNSIPSTASTSSSSRSRRSPRWRRQDIQLVLIGRHRRKGRPQVRGAIQPLTGSVRWERGIHAPPTSFSLTRGGDLAGARDPVG